MEKPEYRSGRRSREVKVYTVCQESRFLIVRNVPALGCIDELVKLFALYGPIEEYRLMDEEECEEFTDVYWLKFSLISNARFAKRKLDDYPFLGHLLQVTYAPNFEDVQDTISKLEERRRTVVNRLKTISNSKPDERHEALQQGPRDPLLGVFDTESGNKVQEVVPVPVGNRGVYELRPVRPGPPQPLGDARYRAPHEHHGDSSMDATVQAVRQRLDKISAVSVSGAQLAGTKQAHHAHSSADTGAEQSRHPEPAPKKNRLDNRRRI
ncbi:hypothetical protein M758_5G171400 [Ceratodon purpureus]|nr:hypothetical protein M758_5G171400 [Ceratodon purpureus]